jgi:hypothetical protein
MPQPIGNLGPFTPEHCTVCRVLIPQVEDSKSSVRKWARHLNYMEHLKKYHPEYYKWSKRWTNTLYLPLVPFVIYWPTSQQAREAHSCYWLQPWSLQYYTFHCFSIAGEVYTVFARRGTVREVSRKKVHNMRTQTIRLAILPFQGFLAYLFCANTLAQARVVNLTLSYGGIDAQGFGIQMTLLALQLLVLLVMSVIIKRFGSIQATNKAS